MYSCPISGLIAGFAAAIISQPADTLLSKINKTKGLPGESISSRLIKMARDLGPAGLFTGMGARYVFLPLFEHVIDINIST
jgi:solute carrier family 25 phosphate transporter 3